MEPLLVSALNKMSGMVIMSEITGPIDFVKFCWQIISPQPWWVIMIIVLRFALPVVWPWITGRYQFRF